MGQREENKTFSLDMSLDEIINICNEHISIRSSDHDPKSRNIILVGSALLNAKSQIIYTQKYREVTEAMTVKLSEHLMDSAKMMSETTRLAAKTNEAASQAVEKAIISYSASSEKISKRLLAATWVMAVGTSVLVAVTIANFILTLYAQHYWGY